MIEVPGGAVLWGVALTVYAALVLTVAGATGVVVYRFLTRRIP